ncbi:MAG: aminomethyl-transferring glycine dehydrogenase subunit GcvPB [Verrucomicrobia bacterium]|nr:aminomethyl-transferring glycine dehydrogenase subunit GcvPB [Verrucomicrobiota bacterium]
MKTIFEKSVPGKCAISLAPCDVPAYDLDASLLRETPLNLPEVSEVEVVRHYTALSKRAYGVDDGFYPLGSCTMKYNPKLNEEVAALPGFTGIHPLQCECTVQGALKAMHTLSRKLAAITGMDEVTLQPAAGAHGEYTALQLIRAYHLDRGDTGRDKIIVPDSAHGTNPASAAMNGYTVVNIPSAADGCVDLDALRNAVGPDTAALMLTNPNTVGIFDKNIAKIAQIVHDAGGLLYYDGANLNAIMGTIRPGDMGYDVVHLNLHKTFSTPHGGGGPGSGPVGCKAALAKYLPGPVVTEKDGKYHLTDVGEKSIGCVKTFYGNFLVMLRALAYIEVLGKEGIQLSSQLAVLNANYMMARLKDKFPTYSSDICMHEFVVSCDKIKEEIGVTALDFAKAMIDRGMHPPTIYFPLIVHEALMFEPTETESKETLDWACDTVLDLVAEAYKDPAAFKQHPKKMPIGRPDEVTAARKPVLIYRA